jgi:hypothetical protein
MAEHKRFNEDYNMLCITVVLTHTEEAVVTFAQLIQ